MAKKLKYHLDHPQIKRNKSWGNDSSPGENPPKKSAGGIVAGVKNFFSGGSKSAETKTNTSTPKTSFATNSGGAAKAASGFGAMLAGKNKK